MAKAKSWEVTDEFWQRVQTLIPLRQRAEDQNYTRKAGGGLSVRFVRKVATAPFSEVIRLGGNGI